VKYPSLTRKKAEIPATDGQARCVRSVRLPDIVSALREQVSELCVSGSMRFFDKVETKSQDSGMDSVRFADSLVSLPLLAQP